MCWSIYIWWFVSCYVRHRPVVKATAWCSGDLSSRLGRDHKLKKAEFFYLHLLYTGFQNMKSGDFIFLKYYKNFIIILFIWRVVILKLKYYKNTPFREKLRFRNCSKSSFSYYKNYISGYQFFVLIQIR